MELSTNSETITCIMCGRTITGDHQEEIDWRSIFYNGIKFHACPDEFSPDPSESLKKMVLVMRRCRQLGKGDRHKTVDKK